MVSPRQIDANRKNAQKSTGPKSSKGKRRASQNATKHGLLGRLPTLIGENPAAYELVVIETIERYGAETHSEVMLAQTIADDLFWLDRCKRAKTQLVRYRRIQRETERDACILDMLDDTGNISPLAKIGQHKATSSSKGAPTTAEQKSEDPRKKLMRSTNEQFFRRILYLCDSDDQVADDIVEVMDELEKLDRYETTRLKSMEKKERLLSSMIARRRDHEKG